MMTNLFEAFPKQGCNCDKVKWPMEVCEYKKEVLRQELKCDCCPYCRTLCTEYVLAKEGE